MSVKRSEATTNLRHPAEMGLHRETLAEPPWASDLACTSTPIHYTTEILKTGVSIVRA